VVRLRLDEMPTNRRELFTAMLDRGIGVNVHYIPVHLQPVYRRLGFSPGQYPQAEQYYREAMTLPLYPGMTDAQHEKVAAALSSVLG
jgi:dTDP-4-amino-4,6-dideoxygalactose transaminase